MTPPIAPDPLSLNTARRFDEIAQGELYQEFVKAIGDSDAKSRRLIAKHCRDGDSILDVGCGPGLQFYTLKRQLPEATFEYTGIDASRTMISHAAKYLEGSTFPPDSVTLIPVDVFNMQPFKDRSYSVVIVRHLLEHVAQPYAVIRECARMCSDRLLIVFSQAPTHSPVAIATDSHFGVPRFAHPISRISQALEASGFSRVCVTDFSPGCEELGPRESAWFATRNPCGPEVQKLMDRIDETRKTDAQ